MQNLSLVSFLANIGTWMGLFKKESRGKFLKEAFIFSIVTSVCQEGILRLTVGSGAFGLVWSPKGPVISENNQSDAY